MIAGTAIGATALGATGCNMGSLTGPSPDTVPTTSPPYSPPTTVAPIASISSYYGLYAQKYPAVARALINALQTGDMTTLLTYEGTGVPGLDQTVLPAVSAEIEKNGPQDAGQPAPGANSNNTGNTGAPETPAPATPSMPTTPSPGTPTTPNTTPVYVNNQAPVTTTTNPNCYKSAKGTCVVAGEYCSASLQGQTVQGIAAPLICTVDSKGTGLRWKTA